MTENKKPVVAAKYRAVPIEDGGFGVAMFVFDDETGRHDTGSIISGVRMTYEKAVASAARWQAKEDKGVAKENRDLLRGGE